jgi:hypothetical protein
MKNVGGATELYLNDTLCLDVMYSCCGYAWKHDLNVLKLGRIWYQWT